MYAFGIPAGVWDGPHSYGATARVFVARGTLRIGYGASNDKVAAKALPGWQCGCRAGKSDPL